MKQLEEKSYNFKAKLDLEMGGNPMLNTEMKGAHKKPYTKMALEMMGQAMEIYTDGKTTVQKNPQTGRPIVTAPGLSELINKLTGGAIDSVKFDPLGWNLALSGGMGMAMSPIPSDILAESAKHFPILKGIDQAMRELVR
jgi:hypothetical protein